MTHANTLVLHRRSDLLATGRSDQDLRREVRDGTMARLCRGVYTRSVELEAIEVQRAVVCAVAERSRPGRVVSHQSAALLHGLPILGPVDERVHFTVDRSGGGRVRSVKIHGTPLLADEVTEIEGVAVTSLARTAIDVARVGNFAQGLTAFDGAQRAGVQLAELVQAVGRANHRKGVSTARAALEACDRRSESVGESWSRAQMLDWPIPAPDLQVPIHLTGSRIVRADFGWSVNGELRVIGEFDGLIKYTKLLGPGQSASDVVVLEKRRENEIRDLGIRVVRWTWDDLVRPARWRAELHRHLQQAGVI